LMRRSRALVTGVRASKTRLVTRGPAVGQSVSAGAVAAPAPPPGGLVWRPCCFAVLPSPCQRCGGWGVREQCVGWGVRERCGGQGVREGRAGWLVRAARGLAVEGFLIAKIFGCAGNEKYS
jgi:hypothetical protein